jgi:cytochrome P450
MSELTPIVDLEDKSYNPFAVYLDNFVDTKNFYTKLESLRAQGPVVRGDFMTLLGGAPDTNYTHTPNYTVLGYDEIVAVNRDPETYSIDVYKHSIGRTFGRSISLMNPPEHGPVRMIFQKAFMPNTVAKWGNQIVTPVINSLIDQFMDRGEAELVSEFAVKYPFEIIYRQLEMPERDIRLFHKLAVSLTQTWGHYINYGIEANRKLGDYFVEMIAARRKTPGDDLVSMLIRTEVDGQHISDETIISFLRQLIAAAGDTTYQATGSLLIGLLQNPDQLEAVRNDRTLVDAAIEEALRWDGPMPINLRMTTRDTELGGVKIEKGAILNVVLAQGNHDAKLFAPTNKFDIFRPRPKQHVGFGSGQHMCLGRHLARLEMTRALNALLDRLPNLRLDPNKPPPEIIGIYARVPRNVHVLFG